MIQSISAAIIFDELSSYKPKQSVAYVVGISILILGVFRLSNRHVNNDSGKLVELSKSMVENVPDEERIHLLRKTPDQLWRKVCFSSVSILSLPLSLSLSHSHTHTHTTNIGAHSYSYSRCKGSIEKFKKASSSQCSFNIYWSLISTKHIHFLLIFYCYYYYLKPIYI